MKGVLLGFFRILSCYVKINNRNSLTPLLNKTESSKDGNRDSIEDSYGNSLGQCFSNDFNKITDDNFGGVSDDSPVDAVVGAAVSKPQVGSILGNRNN